MSPDVAERPLNGSQAFMLTVLEAIGHPASVAEIRAFYRRRTPIWSHDKDVYAWLRQLVKRGLVVAGAGYPTLYSLKEIKGL